MEWWHPVETYGTEEMPPWSAFYMQILWKTKGIWLKGEVSSLLFSELIFGVLNPKRHKIVVFLCSNPNLELFSDKCDLVSFVFVLMVFILVFLKVVVGRWMIANRLSLIFHNQGNIVLPCLVTEYLRWSTNWNVTYAALKKKKRKEKITDRPTVVITWENQGLHWILALIIMND